MKVWVGVTPREWEPRVVLTEDQVMEIMAEDIEYAEQVGEDWRPSAEHFFVDEGWNFKLVEVEESE